MENLENTITVLFRDYVPLIESWTIDVYNNSLYWFSSQNLYALLGYYELCIFLFPITGETRPNNQNKLKSFVQAYFTITVLRK